MTPIVCRRSPPCTAPSGGSCFEGLPDASQCPHVVQDLGDALASPREGEANPLEVAVPPTGHVAANAGSPDGTGVGINSGERLSAEEAQEVMATRRSHLVVLAGMANAGKTTLVTSVYERLQWSPVAGYSFAGSRTLVSFEALARRGRLGSGYPTPDTPRTTTSEHGQYLHLAFSVPPYVRQRDVLFADVPGDHCRAIRDGDPTAQDRQIIGRADQFVVALDGARLLKPSDRQAASYDVLSFLDAATKHRLLGRHSIVQLVTTKWDLVVSSEDKTKIAAFVETVERLFIGQFEGQFALVNTFRTAARDPLGNFPLGFGIDPLVTLWIERRPSAPSIPDSEMPRAKTKTAETRFREFHRYSVNADTESIPKQLPVVELAPL